MGLVRIPLVIQEIISLATKWVPIYVTGGHCISHNNNITMTEALPQENGEICTDAI